MTLTHSCAAQNCLQYPELFFIQHWPLTRCSFIFFYLCEGHLGDDRQHYLLALCWIRVLLVLVQPSLADEWLKKLWLKKKKYLKSCCRLPCCVFPTGCQVVSSTIPGAKSLVNNRIRRKKATLSRSVSAKSASLVSLIYTRWVYRRGLALQRGILEQTPFVVPPQCSVQLLSVVRCGRDCGLCTQCRHQNRKGDTGAMSPSNGLLWFTALADNTAVVYPIPPLPTFASNVLICPQHTLAASCQYLKRVISCPKFGM